MRERKRLGQILRDLQVLGDAEVDRILDAMRRRRDLAKFGQVARDMGLLGEEHILAALAGQMQIFPDIQNLSLHRILHRLQEPIPPTRPCRAPALRSRGGSRPVEP